MIFDDIISGTGVFLILLAFFLQTFDYIKSNSQIYLIMNIIGSALAAYGSYLLGSIPFIILESTWCIVSIIGLLRRKSKVAAPH
ncbi:MAG: CBU_0592 family membrane protein [Saprospiraceae bacterium]